MYLLNINGKVSNKQRLNVSNAYNIYTLYLFRAYWACTFLWYVNTAFVGGCVDSRGYSRSYNLCRGWARGGGGGVHALLLYLFIITTENAAAKQNKSNVLCVVGSAILCTHWESGYTIRMTARYFAASLNGFSRVHSIK